MMRFVYVHILCLYGSTLNDNNYKTCFGIPSEHSNSYMENSQFNTKRRPRVKQSAKMEEEGNLIYI